MTESGSRSLADMDSHHRSADSADVCDDMTVGVARTDTARGRHNRLRHGLRKGNQFSDVWKAYGIRMD